MTFPSDTREDTSLNRVSLVSATILENVKSLKSYSLGRGIFRTSALTLLTTFATSSFYMSISYISNNVSLKECSPFLIGFVSHLLNGIHRSLCFGSSSSHSSPHRKQCFFSYKRGCDLGFQHSYEYRTRRRIFSSYPGWIVLSQKHRRKHVTYYNL